MVPSERPGLVFHQQGRRRSDDRCPLRAVRRHTDTGSVLAPGRGNPFLLERAGGGWPSPQSRSPDTHVELKRRVALPPPPHSDYNHVLTNTTCPKNKRDQAWGLNPDEVYASRLI